MTFIGVDMGTTRVKALLYRPGSTGHRVVARPTPVVPTPLGDFRDAEVVVATVTGCIGDLLAGMSGRERAEIEGIGLTSLSEEMVLVTSDGFSAAAMPAWYTSVAAEQAVARGLDPSFSWSKLRWARDQADSASASSGLPPAVDPASITRVTTLNSYVAGRLGGVTDYAIDHSHASRSGFFDVAAAEWRRDIFAATGWDAAVLPELVETGTVVSHIASHLAEQWQIAASATIVLAGHDHFCGAYGNGVRGDGQLYVSAGTSEAHCLILDDLPRHALPPGFGVGRFVDGTRFYLHRQLAAGHLYRQWTALLGLDGDAARVDETQLLFAEPLGSRGTIVIPGFDGDTGSSLLNLSPQGTSHTVLRALLEGLACAALRIDEELMATTDRTISRIVAAGIPCQSPFWQQLRAHLAPAPLFISDEEEAPAVGAAMLCERATRGVDAAGTATVLPVQTDDRLASAYRDVYTRFVEELARVGAPAGAAVASGAAASASDSPPTSSPTT
jgi:sugar (pentulose or hexulose) kinase